MKNTETIEITSITTTFEKPEDILEPIYLNLFSVKAKDVNNNEYQIISKQFSSFRIVNEHSNLPMLELTLEVNEGLVHNILFPTKIGKEILYLQWNIIYYIEDSQDWKEDIIALQLCN